MICPSKNGRMLFLPHGISRQRTVSCRLCFYDMEENVRCVREGIQKGDADETIENFAEALESFSRMN